MAVSSSVNGFGEGMDMISSLPDGVTTHILSFLPLKESARTSVLSKRWRNLFAFSPVLDFLEGDEQDSQRSLLDFVDRVLAVSGTSLIKKFTLRCRNGLDDPRQIDSWICDVLTRGVLSLDLHLRLSIDDAEASLFLPFEIFTCRTLVELKLTGFWINELPEDAFLPSLEKPFLESVQFCSLHVCAFEKLLSACPVLEEFVIDDLYWEEWKWSRSVSSRSLRKLSIRRKDYSGFDGSDFGSITLNTPSVTHLDYYDFVPDSYPMVNLDSLVEANLHLLMTVGHTRESMFALEHDNITSNPKNLFKGLRNVETMNLLAQDSLEMFYFFRRAIPVFENLFHLSITTIPECCWSGLVCLLNKSPNLETLTIEGTLHYDFGYSVCDCLSGCPVKVVKITEYSGTTEEVVQMKHILGKLPCLELLKVGLSVTEANKSQITKDLLMFPRASSKCKIKVK